MSVKSTKMNYGIVAVTIHWLSAVLIIALLGLGFRASGTVDPAAKASLLKIHASLGVAILVLTITRIVWWRLDRKPVPVGGSPRWQDLSAKAVHVLFYIVILGMAASGIGMFVLSGAGPVVFGGEGSLPDFTQYLPRVPHGFGARAMIVLLVLHAGAALFHHFVQRDATLRRMWFGSKV